MAQEKKSFKAGASIRRCPKECKQKFQDATYGVGNRVHNHCAAGYRCTGCSNVVQV